ncbi:hypothetical protein M501DRAFT_1023505 [Patellaria atrata CBS 101060]|uniref:Heterokaryon incompatibility domain-containing protein n=1 Tax=Patellaria atrata CBS 101060 TaxID=1346257 RepID=A0A9P4SCQ6_9PEZI|nr:hypothetical protein M501DRAFT_1023505 [Patellaria atrata CBS 101060]
MADTEPRPLEKYTYSPLLNPSTDIRLVELVKGEVDEEIRIRIFSASLAEWRKTAKSELSLQELNRKLSEPLRAHVTVEERFIIEDPREPDPGRWQWAFSATLSYLRNPTSSRILWIDAICIDQNNFKERESQVRRMTDIYSSASRVIAWLGPESDSSHEALETIKYIGKQVELLETGSLCPSPDAVERNWNDPRIKVCSCTQTWDAIDLLLNREWFNRVWIIQEILLANPDAVMQCGQDTIMFKLFRRAATCFKENHYTPLKIESRLRFLAKITNPSVGLPFNRVVRLPDKRRCTDPRDYVYGILGLTPKRLAAKIRPDYSLSVPQVYTETTLVYMNHVQRLELIQRTCQYGRLINVPSWVPDLTAKLARKFPCSGQFSAGHSRAHFAYEAPNILRVLGVRGSIVTSVSMIRTWGPKRTPNTTALSDSDDARARRHAHLITLRKGRVRERWAGWERIYPLFDEWEPDWLHFLEEDSKQEDTPSSNPVIANHHVRQTIEFCKGHAYIETGDGYVALAPPDTQVGDFLCVLLGCDVPVVLREKEPETFIVIGECYVDGLKDAFSILGPLPQPWEVQMFRDYGNRYKYRFHNKETHKVTDDDPRLGIIKDWERFDHKPDADDPQVYDYFRHKETGETMNSDPRMLPDALKARNVKLESFTLV